MQQENQQSVGRWIDETFPGADPNSPRRLIRVLEECVEMCMAGGVTMLQMTNALHATFKANLTKPIDLEKIPAECADIFITLCGVASMYEFSLIEEVDKKMEINRARKWRALGDGTGYHIKE